MLKRLRLRPRPDEQGIALVELTAALTILSVGFLALAAGMGGSFRQIALARQRQGAAEVGNGRIEHLRNVPYANIAVSEDVVHNSDPNHPDYFVDDATNSFDYSGNGTFEPLIEDPTAGQVQHLESPVVVGATTLTVYQYVTWVDDPAISGDQNYRRVTVVVKFLQPASTGVARFVRVSSFFTTGSISFGGSSPGVSTGSPSPSSTPTPTPSSTAGSCSIDTTPPAGTFSIFSGTVADAGYTASQAVSLAFTGVSDPCTPILIRFSNDNATYGGDIVYDSLNPGSSWTLAAGDGTKSVWGKFRDGRGNEKTVGPKTVILDTTKPTVPGTLARTVACSGEDRTVNLSWGASTDANLNGYRIYKSVNNGPWTELATISATSKSDTDSKNYDSVRYYVVGYDKAGNESNGTNTIALAKHQCS